MVYINKFITSWLFALIFINAQNLLFGQIPSSPISQLILKNQSFPSNQDNIGEIQLNSDEDVSFESIYYLRQKWNNVNSALASKEFKANNTSIITRALTGGSKLYKKSAPGVVLLSAVDASSFGSGAIISKDGEIITNWHVVEGKEKMLVWLYNSKISKRENLEPEGYLLAEVLAVDENRDLAMLKIENPPAKLHVLSLGRNYEVEIADDVFAIGHPHQYIWTYTTGVISQVRNDWNWSYDASTDFTADVIQTQTPTNPGNSGGPLFNQTGKLIGINSFGRDGEGLNFAIIVDEVRSFVSEAKKGKYEPSITTSDWDSFDQNENGVPDLFIKDIDNDGKYDVSKVDKNEDGIIDYFCFDSNADVKPDIWAFDKDDNGSFEYFLIDDNYDGEIDQIGIDTNGDNMPDQFSVYEE